MSLLGGIGNLFGEATGFGGNGNPDPHNLNDAAYEDYFTRAMSQLGSIGSGTQDMRDKIQSGVMGQLADLDNNAAGRKKNFLEDMGSSFAADMQNRARSAGGTGTMAQVMNPSGGFYDSQARQVSRGLNDLYSKATDDLSQLQGVQNSLYGQDYSKNLALANTGMQRINQRLGVATQNAENSFNSEQAGRQRRMNTLAGGAKAAGAVFGG